MGLFVKSILVKLPKVRIFNRRKVPAAPHFPMNKVSADSGGVGVGGNALIFDLFVYDLLILLLIFLYDPFHVPVGALGKTQPLPSFGHWE